LTITPAAASACLPGRRRALSDTYGREESRMNALLLVCISVGAPVFALTLHDLQTRLERWDYSRHAED